MYWIRLRHKRNAKPLAVVLGVAPGMTEEASEADALAPERKLLWAFGRRSRCIPSFSDTFLLAVGWLGQAACLMNASAPR